MSTDNCDTALLRREVQKIRWFIPSEVSGLKSAVCSVLNRAGVPRCTVEHTTLGGSDVHGVLIEGFCAGVEMNMAQRCLTFLCSKNGLPETNPVAVDDGDEAAPCTQRESIILPTSSLLPRWHSSGETLVVSKTTSDSVLAISSTSRQRARNVADMAVGGAKFIPGVPQTLLQVLQPAVNAVASAETITVDCLGSQKTISFVPGAGLADLENSVRKAFSLDNLDAIFRMVMVSKDGRVFRITGDNENLVSGQSTISALVCSGLRFWDDLVDWDRPTLSTRSSNSALALEIEKERTKQADAQARVAEAQARVAEAQARVAEAELEKLRLSAPAK